MSSTKKESDTVRDALEQEFMERFIKIEGAPEELKFPVGLRIVRQVLTPEFVLYRSIQNKFYKSSGL